MIVGSIAPAVAVDSAPFKNRRLFASAIFGQKLEGELIVDEDGFGIGLRKTDNVSLASLQSEVRTVGDYLILAQTDRRTAAMIAFDYDIRRSSDGVCTRSAWRAMTARACVNALRVEWPDDHHEFMLEAHFVALIRRLCAGDRYRVVEGTCPDAPGVFDVTLKARDLSEPFARLRFVSTDGDDRSGMILTPNVRIGAADPSKLTIYRVRAPDEGGAAREVLTEDEKRRLIEAMN